MNENEELSDEQVDEVLDSIVDLLNKLKEKAEAARTKKKSLPAWLRKLLDDNKPSQN